MSDREPQLAGPAIVARAEQLRERWAHRADGALEPDELDEAEAPDSIEDRRAHRWARAVPSRFLWAVVGQFADPDQPDYYRPTVAADLEAWGTAGGAANLVLTGPVGTGKTHAGVAAARLRFDRGAEVRFLPVVELLDMLRPGGPEGALYDLADTDVLVLDDLGSERPTDWTAERLYALVNRRWMEERPTIATANLPTTRKAAPEGHTGPTLDEALGPRTFSRLVGNGAVVLRLAGPDRRRQRRA